MAPAFSKEAILMGAVDHFCLVCENYLRSEHEVIEHITKPGHREQIEDTDYVEKYKRDRIRKIKKWYFCEFCNLLLSTLTKVRFHVNEVKHIEIKTKIFERKDDYVVLLENIAINEEAWHGLIDDTCIICNVEFDDIVAHKQESTHIINLIETTVSYVNNNVYRKLDDTFHCLTCNAVVADIFTHLRETKHDKFLEKCKQIILKNELSRNKIASTDNATAEDSMVDENKDANRDKDCKVKKGVNGSKDINEKKDDKEKKDTKMHKIRGKELNTAKTEVTNETKDNTSDILDSIEKLQKNNVNINFETQTAVCKTCSNNLKFDLQIIENHIQEHKKPVKKKLSTTTSVMFDNDESNISVVSETLFTSPMFKNRSKNDKESGEIKPKDDSDADILKLVKEHQLSYNTNTKDVHCLKCNKDIEYSIKNINEHVFSVSHISNDQSTSSSKKKTTCNKLVEKNDLKKCELKKIPFDLFLENKTLAVIDQFQDQVINYKYCISYLSLAYIAVFSGGLRCLVCEVNVYNRDIFKHFMDEQHSRTINDSLVIIRSDEEFIREVSTRFHCGYCNVFESSWYGMEEHLKLTSHIDSKTFAKWRLVQHTPTLERDRLQRL